MIRGLIRSPFSRDCGPIHNGTCGANYTTEFTSAATNFSSCAVIGREPFRSLIIDSEDTRAMQNCSLSISANAISEYAVSAYAVIR